MWNLETVQSSQTSTERGCLSQSSERNKSRIRLLVRTQASPE